MAGRNLAPHLSDMVEAAERIHGVLEGVTLEVFESRWKKHWLVERALEIIGTCSRRLTNELKGRHAEIPWENVDALDEVLNLSCGHVAPEVLWKFTQDDLPALEKVLREELATELARLKAIP
jgi:uncharacterized protein with HEPN domain